MSPVAVATALGALVAITGGAVARARWREGAARSLAGIVPSAPAPVPSWFAAAVGRADVDLGAEEAWPWARSGALVLLALGAAFVPALALAVVVAAAVALGTRPARDRRRDRRAAAAELPGAVDALVAALGSGASLAQAFDAAARRPGVVGTDLAVVAARREQGTTLQVALDRWAADQPGTGAVLVADALALAGGSGGSQARALEGVGATLREREALDREVQALGSQARLSALVLVVTPIGFATVVSLIDVRIRTFLLRTPAGWGCLALGLALDLVGAAWMRRLVGRAS